MDLSGPSLVLASNNVQYFGLATDFAKLRLINTLLSSLKSEPFWSTLLVVSRAGSLLPSRVLMDQLIRSEKMTLPRLSKITISSSPKWSAPLVRSHKSWGFVWIPSGPLSTLVGLFRPFVKSFGLCKFAYFWTLVNLFGPLRTLLDSCGSIWNLVDIFGSLWTYRTRSDPHWLFRTNLDPFWHMLGSFNFFQAVRLLLSMEKLSALELLKTTLSSVPTLWPIKPSLTTSMFPVKILRPMPRILVLSVTL